MCVCLLCSVRITPLTSCLTPPSDRLLVCVSLFERKIEQQRRTGDQVFFFVFFFPSSLLFLLPSMESLRKAF